MKLKGSVVLILMTCCAAAVFAWSHGHTRARKAAAVEGGGVVQGTGASLVLAGTIGVPIRAPLEGVGEVPAAEVSLTGQEELSRARKEFDDARSAEHRAEDEVRQAEEALSTMQSQASRTEADKARAEAAEAEAEGELQRQSELLKEGLTPRIKFDSAVSARAVTEEAAESAGLDTAGAAVEADVLEAKALAARADLHEAVIRRTEAGLAYAQTEARSQSEMVPTPADESAAENGQTEKPGMVGAPDSQHMYAYAALRDADLLAVRVGQESTITLDAKPSVTLHARVSAISEEPVEAPEGVFYQVTLEVDNPGDVSLTGAAIHVHMMRSAQ